MVVKVGLLHIHLNYDALGLLTLMSMVVAEAVLFHIHIYLICVQEGTGS